MLLAVAGCCLVRAVAGQRDTICLDGQWDFALSDNHVGTINVPGSWEAQGFGNETVQMRTQVLTGDRTHTTKGAVGVYTKSVQVPACTVAGAKSMLMVDQVKDFRLVFSMRVKALRMKKHCDERRWRVTYSICVVPNCCNLCTEPACRP